MACRALGLTVKVDEDILESRVDGDVVDNRVLMDALELGGYHRGAQLFGYGFTMFTINKSIAPVA